MTRRRRTVAIIVAVLVALYVVICLAVAWVLTMGTHSAITVAPAQVAAQHDDVSFPSRIDLLASNEHVHEYLAHPDAYMAAVYSFIDSQVQG